MNKQNIGLWKFIWNFK